MNLFKLLGVLSPAHISLFTMLSGGRVVGTDQTGNRYFEGKPRKGYKRPRRWVMYKNEAEASLIPPEWHGWIHHQTNAIPDSQTPSHRQIWQKPHSPNMTGTTNAYRPSGHILNGGKRDSATGDYTAWTPSE